MEILDILCDEEFIWDGVFVSCRFIFSPVFCVMEFFLSEGRLEKHCKKFFQLAEVLLAQSGCLRFYYPEMTSQGRTSRRRAIQRAVWASEGFSAVIRHFLPSWAYLTSPSGL